MQLTCSAVRRTAFLAAALLAVAGLTVPAQAQIDGFQDLLGRTERNAKPAAQPKIEARLTPADAEPGEVVTLEITARIPPGHYTYSTNREQGGQATRIVVDDAAGLEAVEEEFTTDQAPHTEFDGLLGKQVEKHKQDVTWSRKYRIKAGADPDEVRVSGKVRYQVCDDRACRLPKGDFEAVLRDERIPNDALKFKATPELADQPGPATVRAGLVPGEAKPGDKVTLAVRLLLDEKWHTYSVTQKPGNAAQATAIRILESKGLKPLDEEFQPLEKPETKSVELLNKTLTQEVHRDEVTWTRTFEVTDARYGVSGQIKYQVCDPARCVPFTVAFEVGPAEETDATASAEPRRPAPAGTGPGETTTEPQPPAGPAEAVETTVAELQETVQVASAGLDRSQGLVAFLIAAVVAGFAALLTPCVFPMVPITVSFFLKQSEKEHHRPVGMALVYCAGIILTFTGLGMLMSILFEATALNRLSNNPWLNLAIAGVLVFFGFNLLGMFEIRIPSGLLTWSSNKETQGGIAGTLFMALTFTLVSFTCTFAFLGGLLVWAAKGEFFWPVAGMLAFSAAFSLPFFFLALFPSFLQKLPKSGGWMNTVKVTMGLIEIGAAVKFLSVADLAWNPTPLLFDYSLVMIGWIVIAGITGLYLLGLFRLPHDTPVQSISVQRLMFATGFLGFAAYLAVGLFSPQKPDGVLWAKIESFLPPRLEGADTPDLGPVLLHDGLAYALDYEQALQAARQTNQPVFLDFTGVNCVNCREMEARMAQPQLRQRLEKFVRVQLYADNVPTITDEQKSEAILAKNRALQETWFGDVTLPSYAVITPDRQVLATVTGQQSVSVFARFLDEGLTKWQRLAGRPAAAPAVAAAVQ